MWPGTAFTRPEATFKGMHEQAAAPLPRVAGRTVGHDGGSARQPAGLARLALPAPGTRHHSRMLAIQPYLTSHTTPSHATNVWFGKATVAATGQAGRKAATTAVSRARPRATCFRPALDLARAPHHRSSRRFLGITSDPDGTGLPQRKR